jgi:sarcosine oxidase
VAVLERGEPGDGQSAGRARGFRHLHATPEKIARAARARAGWDEWSLRAGEQLVGPEGALRLGGDVAADAARLRAAGIAAEVIEAAGERQPALRADAGPLLWDPGGGAIRARAAIEWLCRELGERVRRVAVERVADVRAGHVLVCAGAGTERLWPRAPLRRVVHLRVTFEQPGGGPGATWADRGERFGTRTYGVADAPGRFALGLAELDLQPVPPDPAADVVPPGADVAAARERLHAYARAAFPGLGAPVEEVVRLLTVLPGGDEDEYLIERGDGVTALVGHNLFKLAPVLGEQLADAVAR